MIDNVKINKMKIINEQEFYKLCSKITKKEKILCFFKMFFVYYDIMFLLFIYVIINCERKINSLKKVTETFKYFTLYNYIKSKMIEDGAYDIAIFDQGIVQDIWSINFLYTKKFTKSKLLKYILKKIEMKNDIYYIYYKVDYILAAERASKRKSKCIIDKLRVEEIKEIYKSHSEDYKILLEYLNKSKTFIVKTDDEYINTIKIIKERKIKWKKIKLELR